MLDRLASLILRRARRVLVVTGLFVLVAGALGGPVAGMLDGDDDFDDPASESIVAAADLRAATGAESGAGFVALLRDRSAAGEVERLLEADEAVAHLSPEQVSDDGRSSFFAVTFRADADSSDAALRLADRVERIEGVVAGGGEIGYEQVGEQVSEDLARAELLAFPLLFLLSLWVFRSLVAAALPLAVGMGTILTTFLAIRGIDTGVTSMSVFSINMVTGLGLGLAIDYSLFVVSRFREELAARGGDTAAALRRTMATAGRTVIFSAATVAAALASLTVFPQKFLYSMGLGGALTAIFAAVMALTLLPALLAVLGPRVDALSPRWLRRSLERERTGEHTGRAGWYSLAQFVMRRPGRVALASAALLIALGIPFLNIQFTGVDASALPPERSARVVHDALQSEFGGDARSPIFAVARTGDDAAVDRYVADLRAVEGVRDVRAERVAPETVRVDVITGGRALSDRVQAVAEDVRAAGAPFPARVGGETAEFLDQQESLGHHLPLALALLGLATLAILFAMTGSLVLPVKALVMNLLTLSAALGILVLIFQDGRLEGLLDFESQGALDATQPILLAAMAFGLSTDYGVFLLTRIKEARDAGASDRESVALGLERTGRIVTAAAVLFTVAIGAFATSEIAFIKQVGVGTAAAVFIDATIVRALLVPALMRLLGRWNWWAPPPLERAVRRLGLSET